MSMQFVAILPSRKPAPKINIQRARTTMRQFSREAVNHLRRYPSRPAGSRYKRTRNLQRGWKVDGPNLGFGDLQLEIFNKEDYWIWVQGQRRAVGPGQLSRMARIGWPSITDVTKNIWPKHKRRIAATLGVRTRRVTGSFSPL